MHVEYLALGTPLDKVVEAATASPAKALGKSDEHGSLRDGVCGDAVVIETQVGEFSYAAEDSTRSVKARLVPVLTVSMGKVVSRAA